jgi:hypothetical protein
MFVSDCPNEDVKEQASGALWNLVAMSNNETFIAERNDILKLMQCLGQLSHQLSLSTNYLLIF